MLHTARQLFEPPTGRKVVRYERGLTKDIISVLVDTYLEHWREAKGLAEKLKADNVEETAFQIWGFISKVIEYRLDPEGEQLLKSPSRTIYDGFADCKAYSILAASLLRCLEIPHFFRFVDYVPGSQIPTHVYVVATDEKGAEIPIDACLPEFREKSFTFKKDVMTQISQLSGLGNVSLLEGELEIELMLERLQLEKNLISGISSPIHATYQDGIEVLELARKYAGDARAIQIISSDLVSISGPSTVGFLRIFNRNKKPSEEKKGLGKFLQKVGDKIKAGATAFKNAITAPQKAFANTLTRILLPQIAPAFLYLFLKIDPNQLPLVIRGKREKAARLANFITRSLGMSENIFMQTVRNGIIKKLGDTPENILTRAASGKLSSIGAIQLAAILPAVSNVLKKIFQFFKKRFTDLKENDLPDLARDFAGFKGKEKENLFQSSGNTGIKKPGLLINQKSNPFLDKNTLPQKPGPGGEGNQNEGSGSGNNEGGSNTGLLVAAAAAAFLMFNK